MKTWIWVLIAVGVVLGVGLVVARVLRRRSLQERFGPEYDNALHSSDDRGEAERELAGRVRGRRDLDLRPISRGAMRRYARRWNEIQLAFVELPEGAVKQAVRRLL